MNRRALILQAAQAASAVREEAGCDQFAPVDPYAIARALGIEVRFVEFSMEGFYIKGTPPRILLSAFRPLARRAFTCAHEVGHHHFGHGSTLDVLQEDDRDATDQPDEVLAQSFAGFLLLPSIGIRGAFKRRGWSIPEADPQQIHAVASEFGVGYSTLVSHLAIGLRDLPNTRRTELDRWNPKRIRRALLGYDEDAALTILDAQSRATAVDLEVGQLIALPVGIELTGPRFRRVSTRAGFDFYRALSAGVTEIENGNTNLQLRVAKAAFVGRAIFRHLEDFDD